MVSPDFQHLSYKVKDSKAKKCKLPTGQYRIQHEVREHMEGGYIAVKASDVEYHGLPLLTHNEYETAVWNVRRNYKGYYDIQDSDSKLYMGKTLALTSETHAFALYDCESRTDQDGHHIFTARILNPWKKLPFGIEV